MVKEIKGFENYTTDEYGTITNKNTGVILKPYLNNKGYKVIDLIKNKKKYKFLVHRLVALNFIPNINNYPIVLHLDNNKLNCHVSNLKWGTYSENNAQAIRDGLNVVPRPDNRKRYIISNGIYDKTIECNGAKEVIEKIGYGSESVVRNLLFRQDKIKQGPYTGYFVKKVIVPIKFI